MLFISFLRKSPFPQKRKPATLVRSFVAAALATDPAGLQKHHGQRQSRVNPLVTMPATHRILQQQQPLKIFHAETRQTETRGRAFGTSHWIHRFYKADAASQWNSAKSKDIHPLLFSATETHLAIFIKPGHCEPLYNRSGPCVSLL
jgi:hypothetical protein